MMARRRPTPDRSRQSARPPPSPGLTRLAALLTADLAFDCPALTSRSDILDFIARQLVRRDIVADAGPLRDELLARERLGPTGVGHGIALPHATTGAVDHPVVAVARLAVPVDWDAIDGEPVRLVILILAPPDQPELYLDILAEVARSLSRPGVREQVLKAKTPARAAALIAAQPHPGFLRRQGRVLVFALAVIAIFVVARAALAAVHLPDEGIYQELGYTKFNQASWLFRQQLAITLFLAMVLGTLLFWNFRLAIAAACLGLLLIGGVEDLGTTIRFMSIPTILFIMSMMVIVRWLESTGMFRFVVVKAIERVKGVPWQLLLSLMGFSVILGGFADEVSAILITFGLALEVSRRTRAPLLPYLLSLVFATNVGSALTLVGNPIGVYIAFAGKLSFEHFLRWATPVSAIAAVVVAGLCLLIFRRDFFGRRYEINFAELQQTTEAVNPARLRTGIITFAITVVLIALHRRLELLLNLHEGTVLVAVALMVVGFIVFSEQERGRRLIARGVDWWTLLFFMFLFANAACLEYTGVSTKLGYALLETARSLSPAAAGPAGVTTATALIMLWFSGITSGFVDSLPVVAAMVPIVKDMIRIGLPHASILWWALLFGGCFGGNLTAIGSVASHIAVGAYERSTGTSVRFAYWLKTGIVVTLTALLIATGALLLQIRLAP
jgi:Na+/H+ antiporter NhaD/arsenite permease-like protein/mannitol/fructose-specific phosphotransferase system IIA component (Ntr-type)